MWPLRRILLAYFQIFLFRHYFTLFGTQGGSLTGLATTVFVGFPKRSLLTHLEEEGRLKEGLQLLLYGDTV